jgi:DNA repair protein RadA/Sms
MAKQKTKYVCQECAYSSTKWLGKCPECGQWNSFTEEVEFKSHNSATRTRGKREEARLATEVVKDSYRKITCGIEEFDRVLGKGITVNSLTLIGGEPGIGKSTLLGKVFGLLSGKHNEKVLYVSGEESIGQVTQRIRRLGVANDNFYILHETIWQNILEEVKRIKPDYLVIDSIQTTISDEIQSAPGTVSQVREVTYEVMNHIKASGMTCFIVGHITKEGSIAGPKILEHMVDTVIYFEGDQYGQYRLLRAIKNRFGNTNEVGIFEMKETGLEEVANPSQYFLGEHLKDSYGRSLSCIVEGSRSLLVEVQALVVENKYGNGRRTTQGFDSNRLAMMVAIIEKYFGYAMGFNDIYLNVTGGIKLTGRETDLAIIASLLSSFKNAPIDEQIVFLGEVGLTGEVRPIPFIETRVRELSKLNYRKIVLPKRNAEELTGKFEVELLGIQKATELENLL